MFLRNLWYFAAAGERLSRGAMVHKSLLGEPVLVGRAHSGEVFAIRDVCPHRGMVLSAGRMLKRLDGSVVECPYHGWQYRPDGVCAHIPSLAEGQGIDPHGIRVRAYPCREVQRNIWVFMAAPDHPDAAPADAPPLLPDIGDRPVAFRETEIFDCEVDHAVVGLMDPAHGPFVHRVWWWRTEGSVHEKEKAFGPSPLGFVMHAHEPSQNSFLYRVLGSNVSTEITFRLPGVRIERIRAGKTSVVGLTTVVPIGERRTEVTQSFYWTSRWLDVIKPFFRPMARAFLRQDKDIVQLQQQALPYINKQILIDDADAQAKWYYRLKKNWIQSTETGEPFVNPVKDVVLRWRS